MRYLVVILSVLFFVQPSSAALKRCVDEAGKSHYYNNILPSECQDSVTIEMNKQGVVIKKNEAKAEKVVLSEQEIAAQLAAEQKLIEEARRDDVLLNIYTSEEEIDLARERNIHPVKLNIAGVEKRLEIARARLDNLRNQANVAEKAGSPTLEGIKKDIIPAQKEVVNLQDVLIESQQRMEAIKVRFDADKKRFVELKK